jgi:hypothetical protein
VTTSIEKKIDKSMVIPDNKNATSIPILGETNQNKKRHPEGAVFIHDEPKEI